MSRKGLGVPLLAVCIIAAGAAAYKPLAAIPAFGQRGGDKPAAGPVRPGAGEPEPTVPAPPPAGEPQGSELAFANTTRVEADGRQMVTNADSLLVLVNKERNLPADYVPAGMVAPAVRFPFTEDLPQKYMRPEAAGALEELFAAAAAENMELYAASGYRSYARQKAIFDSRAKTRGEAVTNQTTAYPGQSEHQTGLAMDVTNAKVGFALEEAFGETAEGKWLRDNAHLYGFIIRYPQDKVDVTGYSYEPWHLRYVGKDVAADIYSRGLTLEEYFAADYGY